MFRNHKLFVALTVGTVLIILLVVLTGCKVEGHTEYHKAGEPCYFSGATAVDDQGRELECRRDERGNLTWLIK